MAVTVLVAATTPATVGAPAIASGTAAGATTAGTVLTPRLADDARDRARSTAQRLIDDRTAALHVSARDAFRSASVTTGARGLQYAAYERTYAGLPVFGGDFVVVTDGRGRLLDTTVAQTRTIGLTDLTPAVGAARAVAAAKTRFDTVRSASKAQRVVYALGAPRLAWKVRVSGDQHGERAGEDVYVDATTANVIDHTVTLAAGSGDGWINGPDPLSIRTSGSGSSYSMTDPQLSGFRCGQTGTTTALTGTDDVWGNGVGTSIETGCVDAMYDVQTMNSMLSTWLGRNGPKGDGTSWPIYVGLNDQNAFYCNGQSDCGGRNEVWIGKNTVGKWVTSMDVVGHEYGHGVDNYTPGSYSRKGTQEFVGDVFGALTEWYANQPAAFDPPDYLVGEEVDLVGQGPIRNMYNPSAVGDANCYSSSIDTAEVHAAAGPGNHWFYLASEGSNPTNGQPTSSTCNGTSITGLGIQKAGRIFYNAMLMKTTASGYKTYRTWTLTAAKNLYPGSCTEFNTIKAAWDAVSVPAQSGDPTCSASGTVTVTNPGSKSGTVGTAVSSVTLSASGGTAPYTWTATGLPPGLSVSSGGVISGTPTTAGTYSVTVTATDSASRTGTASFTWTITGGGGGGSQLLLNPGFESGAVNWTGSSGPITTNTGRPARTGSWKMWLGGNGSRVTETLSQQVSIPASATSATLTFWIRIDTSESGSTAYDTAKAQIVNGSTVTTLATYTNVQANATYVQKTYDVSAFKGRTVSVRFTSTEDSSLQTSFVIDDTALSTS